MSSQNDPSWIVQFENGFYNTIVGFLGGIFGFLGTIFCSIGVFLYHLLALGGIVLIVGIVIVAGFALGVSISDCCMGAGRTKEPDPEAANTDNATAQAPTTSATTATATVTVTPPADTASTEQQDGPSDTMFDATNERVATSDTSSDSSLDSEAESDYAAASTTLEPPRWGRPSFETQSKAAAKAPA